jgi:hypothetical protein
MEFDFDLEDPAYENATEVPVLKTEKKEDKKVEVKKEVEKKEEKPVTAPKVLNISIKTEKPKK